MVNDNPRFLNKVILVTGGSRNTGLEIVDLFLREGARVFFCGSTASSAEAGAAELRRRGFVDRFTAIGCDVGSSEQVSAMMDVIEREAGRLDAVVSNAANLGEKQGTALETTEEQFFNTININLGGTMRVVQQASKRFFLKQQANPKTGQRGAIVCIGSNTSDKSQIAHLSYCTSKGGLDAMVRQFAVDLGPLGIRINELCPGYIWSERWLNMPAKVQGKRLANTLIGRISTGHDVAEAVAFLVSDAAPTFHGARIVMDGGATVPLYPSYCADATEPYPAAPAQVTYRNRVLNVEHLSI